MFFLGSTTSFEWSLYWEIFQFIKSNALEAIEKFIKSKRQLKGTLCCCESFSTIDPKKLLKMILRCNES